MKALRFDGQLKLVTDQPMPECAGESLIKVLMAGICNTDLEITRGYAGFQGTLGHEFVGRVIASPESALLNKRVVGEINAGCQVCADCLAGDARHCPGRTVLGIKERDGAFAEYLSLPTRNLIAIPDTLPDANAVFVEPLAAACNILEQIELFDTDRVAVIGDGKLAQLILRALNPRTDHLTVIGKHEDKLALLSGFVTQSIRVNGESDLVGEVLRQTSANRFDLVIEASGSPQGLPLAVAIVKPRGAIVLKSTHHSSTRIDMSQVVVNELKILGSRCGRFPQAIELLASGKVDIQPLITSIFPLDEGQQAFEKARQSASLKVLLQIADA